MRINMDKWSREIIESKDVKNLPVLYFPCVQELGFTVTETVSSPENIAKTMKKVTEEYPDIHRRGHGNGSDGGYGSLWWKSKIQ